MKDISKYFFLGLLFHLFIFALSSFYLWNVLGYYFFLAIDIAFVLAVGLIKGGRLGVVFGASYFLAVILGNIAASYYYRYYPYYYFLDFPYPTSWSGWALNTFILVVYGYLPANYYRHEKTRKSLATGFLIAFFVDLIVSFPYLFYFAALPTIFNLILGGLSALVCFRRLRLTPTPSQPIPKPTPPLSTSSGHSAIRCPNCGHNNPSNFNYCGKCGGSLQEKEETQIY